MAIRIEQLPWRPFPPPSWARRLEDFIGHFTGLQEIRYDTDGRRPPTSSNGSELYQLANCRLDDLQRIKLGRALTKLTPHRHLLAPLRSVQLLAVSNRPLSWLCSEMKIAAAARGMFLSVQEAPFDSVTAAAFNPDEQPRTANHDAILLFLDHGAFLPPAILLDSNAEEQAISGATVWLERVVDGLRQAYSAPVIVTTVPNPPESAVSAAEGAIYGSFERFLSKINEYILRGSLSGEWIAWDVQELANSVGSQTWFDPIRFNHSKAPFAIALCPLVADNLCSTLAALFGKSGRALVLDLDNTLWGGVIADDKLEGIRIGQGSAEGEAYLDFQRTIVGLRNRGIVLAVCSKNQDEIAREPFERHPDMLLGLEHISLFQANWSDKATNVQALAERLNLGLESLVFVDDNPAERARVRQLLPMVKVPEMGEDPAFFSRILVASGYFRHVGLSGDDLQRLKSYAAIAERTNIEAKLGNYEEYLASLEMRMTVTEFDRVGRKRVAQLVSKSNQFNLTTKRYNEVQIAEMERNPAFLTWQVRLADKFGDHGMIAVIIVRRDRDPWVIDTWLMSCRVLERGVEQTLMNLLVRLCIARGIKQLEGKFIPTDRNALVANFYDKMGFIRQQATDNEGSVTYILNTNEFLELTSQIALEAPHVPLTDSPTH